MMKINRHILQDATNVTAITTIIVLLVFGIGYIFAYFFMSIAPQENSRRVLSTVKAVCDYSRDVTSLQAEEACGAAQDASQTEYLCPSYTSATSECWVEDHMGEY